MRGRPTSIRELDKFEMRLAREAGISIDCIAGMWHIGKRRVHEILAELRAKFGAEKLPQHKRHLVRLNSRRSSSTSRTSTET
jgi:hypothetical protein